MSNPFQAALQVAKEEIHSYSFPSNEVLESDQEINQRKRRIVQSVKVGNSFKQKVRIKFMDRMSLKEVKTTIWGMTEKNIILKRGTIIPIHRIVEISFY